MKTNCFNKLRTLMFSVLILNCATMLCTDAYAGTVEKKLIVLQVDITPQINTGSGNNLGSFSSWARLRATVLAISPDGESMVGWHASDDTIHITPLTADCKRKRADIVINSGRLYDMIAHEDGVAVLRSENNRMYIEKYTTAGQRTFQTELTDADDRIDGWHGGKLNWNGTTYAAYFAIHATAGWAEGHEGDKLKYINADGSIQEGGWEWGCSHSMDVQIPYAGSVAMPVCISDCYPGKGIYLNNSHLMASSDGNCSGSTNARFGQTVYFKDYLATIFLSIDAGSDWDVVFVSMSANDPYTVRTEKMLTNPGISEMNPKIIPYDEETLLASWEDDTSRVFQRLDLDGNPVGEAETVDVKCGPVNDFKVFPNGDIGWAYAWDDLSKLKIMRIKMTSASSNPALLHLLLD